MASPAGRAYSSRHGPGGLMPAAARRHLRLFVLLLVAALWTAPAARAESAAVDIELVLAVDVSRSIDDDEYALQKRGYAEAFVNPAGPNAIRANPHHPIPVTLFEWPASDLQKV